ncbi:MAG: hypothetical protein WCG95_03915 [bacterium]
MLKKFVVFFIFACFILVCSGCDRPKTIILFNNAPITKENILSNATEFTLGKRIYYVFMTEKKLETDLIRIRILKRNEKANFQPTKLFYSNDFRLYKDQIYYYNDYIVIHESGYYGMVIYAQNQLNKPLATANFRVK